MTLDSIPTQPERIGGVSLQAGGALDPESPETERAIKAYRFLNSAKGRFFLLTFLSVRGDFQSTFEYLFNYLIWFINILYYHGLCSVRRSPPASRRTATFSIARKKSRKSFAICGYQECARKFFIICGYEKEG